MTGQKYVLNQGKIQFLIFFMFFTFTHLCSKDTLYHASIWHCCASCWWESVFLTMGFQKDLRGIWVLLYWAAAFACPPKKKCSAPPLMGKKSCTLIFPHFLCPPTTFPSRYHPDCFSAWDTKQGGSLHVFVNLYLCTLCDCFYSFACSSCLKTFCNTTTILSL